jgi:RNA polymerase sigma factor for flagellar operon FliA
MRTTRTELGEQEKEQLINDSLPFIKYTAYRLSRRLPPRLSVNDLVHVGIMGLLEALERYRPGQVKLKTFAEYRIKGAMLDELRAQDWLPRSLRDKMAQIRKAQHDLESELGRAPDDDEIAARVNMSLDEYFRTVQGANNAVVFSFEDFRDPVHQDGPLDVRECIGDLSARSPLEILEQASDKDTLSRLISALPEKEKLILSLYYWEELTMKEIGKVLGLSEGRICQIHSQVLLKLRTTLGSSLATA